MTSTCKRCERPLTDPVSIRRGYGPLCWSIFQHIANPNANQLELINPKSGVKLSGREMAAINKVNLFIDQL